MIDLKSDKRHEYVSTYFMSLRYYDQRCKHCRRPASALNRYIPCTTEREALRAAA